MPDTAKSPLAVAVTGPTGTFGFGLVPLLEADHRIGRIAGIARRPFDPARHGWSKMTYRRGDVRDRTSLDDAFQGADVVVHLAFLVLGTASAETTRSVNVDAPSTRWKRPQTREPGGSSTPRPWRHTASIRTIRRC